jgi:hypothetical protein
MVRQEEAFKVTGLMQESEDSVQEASASWLRVLTELDSLLQDALQVISTGMSR